MKINYIFTKCMASREGSPNKNKQFLLKRLQDMYGEDFDPIIKAAENAVRMQELAETSEDEFACRKECVTAWDKIAQYVTPKLKAMEITGEDGGALQISITSKDNAL